MDCPHHDHLGRSGRRDGPGEGPAVALSDAPAPGRGRSRLLSRRDSLPDVLVSGRVPRPDHRIVHSRDSGVELPRVAHLSGYPVTLLVAWAPRLSMNVDLR